MLLKNGIRLKVGAKKIITSEKTFKEVAEDWLDNDYKNKVKERTYQDRRNKFNQILRYIGEEKLIADLERDKGGREYFKKLLKL